MTVDEFAYIAAALQTAFPWAKLFPNEQAMDIWFRRLEDLPGNVVTAVVNRWLETSREPPTIADIRSSADLVINGEIPDWGAGWEQVRKAIGRYGTDRKAAALATMDELTRQTVERLGWQVICESENADVLRANFRMCYETLARRRREDRLLTGETRDGIAQIQGRGPSRTQSLVSGLADRLKLDE